MSLSTTIINCNLVSKHLNYNSHLNNLLSWHDGKTFKRGWFNLKSDGLLPNSMKFPKPKSPRKDVCAAWCCWLKVHRLGKSWTWGKSYDLHDNPRMVYHCCHYFHHDYCIPIMIIIILTSITFTNMFYSIHDINVIVFFFSGSSKTCTERPPKNRGRHGPCHARADFMVT